MRDNVCIFMCDSSARRYRGVGHKMVAFLMAAFIVLSLLTINPLSFDDGRVSAAPGTPKLSTTYIALSTTATGTSLALTPDTGFSLSDAASTAAFDVTTDNFTGYSIKITAADNDRTLVNTANSSQVINSISEPTAQSDFVATDQTLINHWGIKPNKYYNNGSTITNTETIFPAPNEAGLELDVTSAANVSVANTYSVAVGAMLDSSIPSGTYTRETTIVVIPNPIYYVLNYDKNTNDTVANLPGADSGSATSTKITINSTAPERASYVFSGWCLGTTTTTDGVDSCDGTVFQPGDEFGIDQTVENTSTLYAMWQVNAFSCAAEYRLQNADGTYPSNYTSVGIINPAVPYGQTCSYTSTQDSTLYTNQSASETVTGPTTLQLDIPRTTFTLTINKNDTWVTGATGAGTHRWGETVAVVATLRNSALFNGWSQTAGASSTFADNTSANTTFTMPVGNATIYADAEAVGPAIQNLARSACPRTPTTVYDVRDDEVYTVQRLEDGRCWMTQNLRLGKTTDTLALTSANSDVSSFVLDGKVAGNAGEFKDEDGNEMNNNSQYACNDYGCYYNWYTATAGTIPDTPKNATTSICPAGWTLPDGSDNNDEFMALVGAYGNSVTDILVNPTIATENTNGASAPGFTLAGRYTDEGGIYLGEKVSYWTKTSHMTGRGRNLSITYPDKVGVYGTSSWAGFPVRCLLRENVNMQNISKDYLDVAIPNNGDHIILTDTRDNNKYQVTKINGEVWMTQNLRITGTVTADGSNFTGADFNVSEYSLDSNDSSYAGHCDIANGYNYPCSKYSDDTTTGAWYNYAAVTAGAVEGNETLASAIQDICPAGWRLPSGPSIITNTSLNKLVGNTTSGWQSATTGLTNFGAVSGGYYDGGTVQNTGYGNWWSTIALNAAGRYSLSYNSGNGQFSGDNSNDRQYGSFVRCVLGQTTINDISTMQGFGTLPDAVKDSVKESMAIGATYTLTDIRDGESYKIAKLADGKIWMLENLNLAGGTALSADDTDVTSEYISGFPAAGSGRLTKDGNTIVLPASATKRSDNNNLTESGQFSDNNSAYVFNSGNKTSCEDSSQNIPCYSYYSGFAATLGLKKANGTDTETSAGYNAAASICPKGWRLPKGTTSDANAQQNNNWMTGDWYTLATAYGVTSFGKYGDTKSDVFYNNAGPGTTPNFLTVGQYDSSTFGYGTYHSGWYWSSTLSGGSTGMITVTFSPEQSNVANSTNRRYGLSVRCLAR